MRKKTILTMICALSLVLAIPCANAQTKKKTADTTTSVTKKKSSVNHVLKGDASYYGENYSSTRKTASGEQYSKNKLTAAHKTLPFGTMVKVTNKSNNKSVIVKINDRGPFCQGRVIDLSVAAAKKLDIMDSGVAQVTIKILSKSARIPTL